MSTVDRDHVLRLCAYHHWAADRMLTSFTTVTAAQLDKPWGGSFATGRGLLEHVVGSDRVWVTRWRGTSVRTRPEFPGTWDGSDFRAEWAKIKADELRFLDTLKAEQLSQSLNYSNLKGEAKSHTYFDVLVHVVNHGTYHRGQLTHLLRDLGVTPPSTDFMVFVEEQRGRS